MNFSFSKHYIQEHLSYLIKRRDKTLYRFIIRTVHSMEADLNNTISVVYPRKSRQLFFCLRCLVRILTGGYI